jgi:lactam utilization protein B
MVNIACEFHASDSDIQYKDMLIDQDILPAQARAGSAIRFFYLQLTGRLND